MTERIAYAEPQYVEEPSLCFFYHTIDLPKLGTMQGLWDLRGHATDYLGHADLAGKRVLELGCASGFLTFEMEAAGAQVVGCDLSPEQEWDSVPYASRNLWAEVTRRRDHIRKLNASFWLSHRLKQSAAKVIYGSVYDVPVDCGPFDVAVFGSILLHLRDPFLALQRSLALTRELAIVTEMRSRWVFPGFDVIRKLLPSQLRRPANRFIPDFRRSLPVDTWWRLEPEIVVAFLGVLGFEKTSLTYHSQVFQGRKLPLFTIVAKRARGDVADG